MGLALFWGHGLGKWMTLFGGGEIQFAAPFKIEAMPSLAVSVFTEAICAILLILGLLTRWALIPLIINMLVAIAAVHISDGFGVIEKALVYLLGFIMLVFTGPGRYFLDFF